jgi:prepilin-type N-terminal cleavage/methylation domain-containing protein
MSPSLEKLHSIPRRSQSFTLIELLVVIAILALLMSMVVITLNPAEMLRKSRDTKRISELKELNNALGVFQANKSSTSLGTASTTYVSIPAINSNCSDISLPTLPTGYSYACSTTTNYKKTDGTGWIPINFNSLDTGSPIATLATDPTNATTTGLFYTYTPSSTAYELNTTFESNVYRLSGDSDKASTDGGDSYSIYEIGTDLTLNPLKDSGLAGYWRMDGGTSGSIVNNQTFGLEDTSGNSNNGTAKNSNGTGMAWIQGKTGGAVSFDGVDDYVNSGSGESLNLTGNLTLVAWINLNRIPTTDGNSMEIITKNVWNENGFSFWAYYNPPGAGLRFMTYQTGAYQDKRSPNVLVKNIWQHVAVVLSGTTSYFYVNGVNQGTGTGYIPPESSSGKPLLIGVHKNFTSYRFDGLIDDVRIYNRALSAAEISAIYNASR